MVFNQLDVLHLNTIPFKQNQEYSDVKHPRLQPGPPWAEQEVQERWKESSKGGDSPSFQGMPLLFPHSAWKLSTAGA